MNLILESSIVGLYSLLISLPFNDYIISIFIIGYLKHLIGGISGIHSFYCKKNCNNLIVFLESILEGILYIILYLILFKFIPTKLVFFFIGAILHILFEVLYIHYYFCKYRCFII